MNDAIMSKLRERVKELTALHRTARILQNHALPAAEVMDRVVALLPGAWQYPEVTAARIEFRGEKHVTEGFRETSWAQRADFSTRSGEGGSITVVYLEERPSADEGPFRLLDQTIRYTRDLTGEISPPVLYELGLEPALDWLAEYFTTHHRFDVRFQSRGRARDLPEELAVFLFKSARELLVNSLKHSEALEADLELRWGDDELILGVADRGRGFDPVRATAPGGDVFGLFSIRERFRDLGGAVNIDASPGAGCRVMIRVPRARKEGP